MQVKIKVVGEGIFARGKWFRPDKNDGLYVVEKDEADYLIATFPRQFVLIEKVAEQKMKEKVSVAKKSSEEKIAKATRKRQTNKKA